MIAVPFEVSHGTGIALVQPNDADFRFTGAGHYRVGRGEDVPERIRAFAEPEVRDRAPAEFDLDPEKFESSNVFERKYTERRIEPGDEVCVCGEPSMDEDAWSGSRIEMSDGDGKPYLITEGTESDVSRLFLNDVVSDIAIGVLILTAFYWFFSPPSTFVEYLFSTPVFWR